MKLPFGTKKLPILVLFALVISCNQDNQDIQLSEPSYIRIDEGEKEIIKENLFTTLGPMYPADCPSQYLMYTFRSEWINGQSWILNITGPTDIHVGTFDLQPGCTEGIQYVELRKVKSESYKCIMGDGYWFPPVETTCTREVNVSEFYFQKDDFKHDVPGAGTLQINMVDQNKIDLSFDFKLADRHIAGRYSGAFYRGVSSFLNIPWRAIPQAVPIPNPSLPAYDPCFYFSTSLHPEPLTRQILNLNVNGNDSKVTAIIELSGNLAKACYNDELSFNEVVLILADRDNSQVVRYDLLKGPLVVDFKAEPGNRLVFTQMLNNLQMNHRYALTMHISHQVISYDGELFPIDFQIYSYFTFSNTPFSCINENKESVVTCN